MPDTMTYTVRRGDSLQRIVQGRGFQARDWARIYSAPYNRALRRLRPDPDHIEPGDQVEIPLASPTDLRAAKDALEALRRAHRVLTDKITRLRDMLGEINADRGDALERIGAVRRYVRGLRRESAAAERRQEQCLALPGADDNRTRHLSCAREYARNFDAGVRLMRWQKRLQRAERTFEALEERALREIERVKEEVEQTMRSAKKHAQNIGQAIRRVASIERALF